MKTTAIQQVAHDLYDIEMPIEIHVKVMLLLKKHFETTEKDQITDAVKYGFADAHKPNADINFIHYYEKTYGITNKETLK